MATAVALECRYSYRYARPIRALATGSSLFRVPTPGTLGSPQNRPHVRRAKALARATRLRMTSHSRTYGLPATWMTCTALASAASHSSRWTESRTALQVVGTSNRALSYALLLLLLFLLLLLAIDNRTRGRWVSCRTCTKRIAQIRRALRG